MRGAVILFASLFATSALAQHHGHHEHPQMDMSSSDGPMQMSHGFLGSYPTTRDASGTSWQPDAAAHSGLHTMAGPWMVMGHFRLDAIYDWQRGPRGDDMGFLAGMAMGMAMRDFGANTLMLRAMLSPDPVMGKRGYPLLLASGETADGVTHLIDRQHPHDLVMELSATASHRFDQHTSAFVYFGYPGEPAFGPSAFMHRASAMDNPAAPITHHWLDSTHITFGVLTAGVVHENWKLELSRFTGREPDQFRFNFDKARFDSTAARLSFNPGPNWSLQASWAFLKSPEQLEPEHNESRFSASATYAASLGAWGRFAATAAWGLKRTGHGDHLNALLAEAEWMPAELWTLFTRAEWVENAELLPGHGIARASKLTLGAIRDFKLAESVKLGIGLSGDLNLVGQPLKAAYGGNPTGTMVFTRLAVE